MKIVHVEDFFHPDAGYQINIIPKYMVEMGNSVTIITSEMEKIPEGLTSFFGRDNIIEKDARYSDKYGVKIVRVPLCAFVSGRAVFSRQLFTAIKQEKPDVVYIHGNDTLTAMRYLLRRKKYGFPLVMDSHMLEMASQNRFNKIFRWGYRHAVTPNLIKNRIPVIRTQDDPYVEKCLGVPLKQAPWISVGSDTLIFHPDESARRVFREAHNISNSAFVVLYAGKLDEAKGGMLLAKAVEKKFSVKRELIFVIVGKASGEYGDELENVFSRSENRILRFPTQKYCDLPLFYQSADIAVFPRQCSLSFYDVQACGLPVIFEDNSINIDRAKHQNGFVFKADNLKSLRNAIEKAAAMDGNEFEAMCQNAVDMVRNNYDYRQITQKYMAVIMDIANRGK